TFVFASITTVLGYIVSGLGNGMINMLGTAIRQFIVLVPCAYAMTRIGGIQYAWYAMWLSEVGACVYAIVHSRLVLRSVRKGMAEGER
ncbi:MAG: hypothetical protein LUE86_13040, partial [Clostridiales bacterium]|nr:hypothetical protein [Clostridiales bacterium]